MKKPTKEIKSVIAWMQNQMYDGHTEWACGNKHDAMREVCDFLERLARAEED